MFWLKNYGNKEMKIWLFWGYLNAIIYERKALVSVVSSSLCSGTQSSNRIMGESLPTTFSNIRLEKESNWAVAVGINDFKSPAKFMRKSATSFSDVWSWATIRTCWAWWVFSSVFLMYQKLPRWRHGCFIETGGAFNFKPIVVNDRGYLWIKTYYG